ncbi:MAG: hypothetical protein Q8O89_07220, partial [Nanoarchaeota archaeon]|nr:hypothetical protein [Nanoarchaeota archaeon]
ITIVENSKEGKQINDPSKFYVSDMFQNVIYKISESNEVSVLAKDIGYPNSLVVDYWGRVLFTTTPLKSSNDYLITQPQLIAINPKTGVHKALFSFNMSYDDADTGLGYILSADERGTISLPISFRIDAVLYDDLKNFEYVFVNNHAGKLENLSGKLE